LSERLSDHVTMTFGFAFKSAQFTSDPSDVRLLRGDNIAPGRLRWTGAKRWPLAEAAEVADYQLTPGDVVIAMDRPWIEAGLKYAVVRDADLPALLVQRVARLQALPTLDQSFLAYLIGSRAFAHHVRAVQTGSAVPHISGAQIGSFRIPRLPALSEQRGIATTLRSLDDLIENGRRLSHLIPEFIAARVGMAIDNAPSAELPVGDLARFVNGGAYTKGASGSGRMVLRIAELNSGPGGSTVYNDLNVPDDKLARPGDLLMSWSGSLDVYRWAREEAIINQHIFKVIPESFPPWLVHDRLAFVMPVFQTIAKNKATTMGHIQRGHLESTTVPMPALDVIDRLDRALQPMWDRLLHAERESLRLGALRDVLLPGLLSGRTRVPEAREAVEVGA
jgi:type I restriction enzyme, S subunit